MDTKRSIATIGDIRLLVNTFYDRVKTDALLGPIFNGVLHNRWPMHLEKMYSFWETVLLDNHTYGGSPFPPHAQLPVNAAHFEAWLALWNTTVDSLFEGAKAEEAKWRGNRMATMFLCKIDYHRARNSKPLI